MPRSINALATGILLARRECMRIKLAFPLSFVVCAAVASGCSSGHLPSSPSMLNPQASPSGAGARFRTLDEPPMPPTPTPAQVLINIVAAFGTGAFTPNPTPANMGDQIVFTNTDVLVHHIVLDDGTDLGEVQPGQSTQPMALATPTATYHCTIHPTMVGSINGELPPAEPYYPPPAPSDYYGGYY